MTKKPRQQLKVLNKPKAANQEFRNCDSPGCLNIISVVDRPQYTGPIYCLLHMGYRRKS